MTSNPKSTEFHRNSVVFSALFFVSYLSSHEMGWGGRRDSLFFQSLPPKNALPPTHLTPHTPKPKTHRFPWNSVAFYCLILRF